MHTRYEVSPTHRITTFPSLPRDGSGGHGKRVRGIRVHLRKPPACAAVGTVPDHRDLLAKPRLMLACRPRHPVDLPRRVTARFRRDSAGPSLGISGVGGQRPNRVTSSAM